MGAEVVAPQHVTVFLSPFDLTKLCKMLRFPANYLNLGTNREVL